MMPAPASAGFLDEIRQYFAAGDAAVVTGSQRIATSLFVPLMGLELLFIVLDMLAGGGLRRLGGSILNLILIGVFGKFYIIDQLQTRVTEITGAINQYGGYYLPAGMPPALADNIEGMGYNIAAQLLDARTGNVFADFFNYCVGSITSTVISGAYMWGGGEVLFAQIATHFLASFAGVSIAFLAFRFTRSWAGMWPRAVWTSAVFLWVCTAVAGLGGALSNHMLHIIHDGSLGSGLVHNDINMLCVSVLYVLFTIGIPTLAAACSSGMPGAGMRVFSSMVTSAAILAAGAMASRGGGGGTSTAEAAEKIATLHAATDDDEAA